MKVPPSFRTPPLRHGVALAALIGLCACAASPGSLAPPRASLPTEHYPVTAEDAPVELALAVHPEGVSSRQQAALSEFVQRWRTAGSGAIVLRTPADPACAQEARTMAYAVQSQLQGLGVPSDRVRLEAYDGGGPHAPVLAIFHQLAAVIPDCSGGWDNLTSTFGNEPYHHFGCAVSANLAAQIADPRDLVSPPDLAPADGVRRQIVLGKYRDGKITATEKDEQASGSVSSSVK